MELQKKTNSSLSINQITPGISVSGHTDHSGSQPPRKSTAKRPDSMMTFMYSPRKNSRNGVEEYSTMKPATSSDSASSRSNGGRWVSASVEMKKTIAMGNRMVNRNQPCAWAITMAERFSEPANSSTVMSTKPMETS